MSHRKPCPISGCRKQIPLRLVVCQTCWYRLSLQIRQQLIRANETRDYRALATARGLAIEQLNPKKEGMAIHAIL